MSKEKQHSNDLLRKWLRIDISEKEKNALRQQGADDPFLMDAMDGFKETKGIQSKHLDETRERLRKRYNQKSESRGVFYITRIAAAIAFIAAGMWVMTYLNDNAGGNIAEQVQETTTIQAAKKLEKEEVGMVGNAETAISEDIEDVMVDINDEEIELVEINVEEVEEEVSNQGTVSTSDIASIEKKVVENTSEIVQYPSADAVVAAPAPPAYREQTYAGDATIIMSDAASIQEDEIAVNASSKEESRGEFNIDSVIAEDVNETKVSETSKAKSQGKIMDAATMSIVVITGTIVDENGEALIGANVQEVGTTNGVITDIDGTFELNVDDSNTDLKVSYTGYTTQTISTQNLFDNNNIIALIGGEVLSEVVVTGYGAAAEAENTQMVDTYTKNTSLKRFIKDNLQYPEEAKANKVQGKVVLEFTINENGRPENIQVKKSLGSGCDEEAIRLIKTGPDWDTNNPGAKVKYTIKFK